MNNERNNTTAGGIGFCGLLAVAFIVLKLTGVINWSWLWVLAPIWIPTAITLAIIVIVLVATLVRELTKGGRRMKPPEERRALLDRAITTYGAPAQMDMAVEEMAELTKALCKIKRAQAGCEVTAAIGNVVEEMADVQIMLDQLRIIFHRSTEEVEEAKLERLKNRLDGRNNWQDSSLHKWIEKQFPTGGDGHE